ncbi:MAG TPA: 3-dehydroquinate synthase [Bacteroidota bacterium]|nr:3-dehydroquinate synthase [Bacteroidota bacterium]
MNSLNNSAASLNTDSVETVIVDLGDRRYPIEVGSGLIDSFGAYYTSRGLPSSAVVITDSNVAPLYGSRVVRSLKRAGCAVHTIIIPPGEKEKSFSRAEAVFADLLTHRIERNAAIVAVGGGVIGDLAGFIAATYQRGVRFVQVPTTLLAQVDSSVGGKVAINHRLGKNMVGAFYQPDFVLADVDTLATLPKREVVCGLGEVIKYGIIMNAAFYADVAVRQGDILACRTDVMKRVVAECCRMKAEVVEEDEREQGRRAILNFGHTIGHALEHAGHFSKLKHGEGVILGMLAEARIAVSLGMLSQSEFDTIEKDVADIPMPRLASLPLEFDALYETMRIDKKSKDGAVRLVLPEAIGSVRLPQSVDKKLLRQGVAYLKKRLR